MYKKDKRPQMCRGAGVERIISIEFIRNVFSTCLQVDVDTKMGAELRLTALQNNISDGDVLPWDDEAAARRGQRRWKPNRTNRWLPQARHS